MKRILVILLCAMQGVMMYAWKPIFVGHRGCIIGVENTREAFINAKDHYHYEGVETDLMTTKDNKLVMCHDGELSRFGLTGITVSQYTLAELQAMTLTQKRYGVTYTAKLLSVDEFCALIDSLGMFPIIEIKGSGGIYEESMYNFPQVVTALQNHNLMDKAIILASYKKSLAYIRTNYPSLKCQLLRYNLSDEDFEWCRDNGVEPSMCNSGGGNLTQELVKRCHDADMNVGVWVIDWSNVYDSNCGWGCYMCTTDSLTPALQKDLPEVQWDKVKPFSAALSPIYVNEITDAQAPTSGEGQDTLRFWLDTHEFKVYADGAAGEGGWALKDYSTTGEPISYRQAAFLKPAVSPLKFVAERVDTSTVNVYEMNNSTLVGAWRVSTLPGPTPRPEYVDGNLGLFNQVMKDSALTVKRALSDGKYLFVLAYDNSKKPYIYRVNKEGVIVQQFPTDSCTVKMSGGWTVGDIALSTDGYLFAMNRETFMDSYESTYGNKIYTWAPDGTMSMVYENRYKGGQCFNTANFVKGDPGASMTFVGDHNTGLLVFGSENINPSSGTYHKVRYVALQFAYGNITGRYINSPTPDIFTTTIGSVYELHAYGNHVVLSGSTQKHIEMTIAYAETGNSTTVSTRTDLAGKLGFNIGEYDEKVSMFVPSATGVDVYDIDASFTGTSHFTQNFDSTIANGYLTAGAFAGDTLWLIRDGYLQVLPRDGGSPATGMESVEAAHDHGVNKVMKHGIVEIVKDGCSWLVNGLKK